jgi:N-sulfoglucosamine sulfohydrolase
MHMFMKKQIFTLSLGAASVACGEQTASRPNILFCIADDAGPHMGAYGCPWVKTPGFDRVADEGLLFSNAFSPDAKCAPARAGILTGRYPWTLGEAAHHWCIIPDQCVTVMESLGERGYFTGYTGKGWEPAVPGEGRRVTGRAFDQILLSPPPPAICPVDYAANFTQFLNERPDNQPFFFWYGSYEPHLPYEFGSGIHKGGKMLSDIDQVPPYWPDNETVRTAMLDYAYEIEHFDLHLGRMLDELQRRDLLDNTLIIVTSDQGMPFPRMKGNAYKCSNHVPMAMMWKRAVRAPRRVIDDYVSLIDLAPTFLELAGIDGEGSGMLPIQGHSLTSLFSEPVPGSGPVRDHVLVGKERHTVGRPADAGYPIRGIIKDGWLCLKNVEPDRWPSGDPQTGYMNVDGSRVKTEVLNSRVNPEQPMRFWDLCFGKRPAEELYHIGNDPYCVNNLAEDPAFKNLKRTLLTRLEEELAAQGDPRMHGEGHLFDQYPYGREVVRNYYNRFMGGERIKARWINETDFEPDFPRRDNVDISAQ